MVLQILANQIQSRIEQNDHSDQMIMWSKMIRKIKPIKLIKMIENDRNDQNDQNDLK